jgi:eukaryotic-like serine/threonine-protein kinase
MVLSAGARLGPYEILSAIGAGGMGEVYRARDSRLGRDIAIKVLPHDVHAVPEHLARFEREAKAVAGLNHPNIVVLHSIEDAGGVRFITMELVEGQTLATLVTPGGLPLRRLLELSIPLADALVAAHEKGVVHRDLKPGNVMVTREGRVKVLDFGLARVTDTHTNLELTYAATEESPLSAGQVVGTIPYMAPEQIRGEAVDPRSDLFAFGIMLYELSTGKRPFAGQSQADISSSILRDTPPSIASVRTDLPGEVVHIVERCLEKNPRERFQTALDVLNELRSIRRELERSGAPTRKPASDKAASIAVLPFVNRSASADDEYFSDGLADELLNVLAKIKGLRVSARTSAFTFKGKQATVAEIGQVLNVATVLEGSVRKAGSRVRIAVQLVNVSDSSSLWSETYDRTLEDIFAVQDDIAHSVVKELRRALLGEEADSQASGEAKAEVARAAQGRATNPEAHRLLLLARYLVNRMTGEDTAKAIEYLRQALAMNPEFALGWADLSRAYSLAAGKGWVPLAEGYGLARGAADRALLLEPNLAEGHAALGYIQMIHDWDWRGAEASFARALELAPEDAEVLRTAGTLDYYLCRVDRDLLQRAVEQDPLSARACHNLGSVHKAARRSAEAEAAYRKALEIAPQRGITRGFLALSLLAQGRGGEALAEAMREPSEWARLRAQAIVHHALGHGAESDAALRELSEKYADDGAFQVAEVHAARGEVDAAFEWLERAYAQRDGGLIGTKAELSSLRVDPRWNAFLRKMGFED